MSNSFNSSSSIAQAYLADNYGIELDTSFAWTKLRYPVCGLMIYLLSIKMFEPKEETETVVKSNNNNKAGASKTPSKPEAKKLGVFELLMLLHNIILCVFSFLTFVNTFPYIYNLFSTYGFRESITTDKFAKLYDGPYGYWSHLFYLSKFYEFVDTWIVICRGKKPMFLQVYHHTGAVICMWLVMVTKSSGGYFFVVENSFIHTIMYFYYAMTIVGCPCRNKHLITTAQMLQFIVGVSGSFGQVFVYGSEMRWEDKMTIYANDVYVVILFVLFWQFYQKSYSDRKSSKELKKEA